MQSGKLYTTIIIIILIQGIAASLWGQTYHTRSQRALRAYTEAKRAHDFYDYRTAEQRLKEAISVDDGFFEAYVLLAEISFDRRLFEFAAENYRKALKINEYQYKLVYYYLGVSEFNSGQYELALESLRKFLETGEGSEKLRRSEERRVG